MTVSSVVDPCSQVLGLQRVSNTVDAQLAAAPLRLFKVGLCHSVSGPLSLSLFLLSSLFLNPWRAEGGNMCPSLSLLLQADPQPNRRPGDVVLASAFASVSHNLARSTFDAQQP